MSDTERVDEAGSAWLLSLRDEAALRFATALIPYALKVTVTSEPDHSRTYERRQISEGPTGNLIHEMAYRLADDFLMESKRQGVEKREVNP